MTPRVEVLASESIGVRAFALKVVTPEGVVVVDPSVALAPHREGYPVSPPELRAFREGWARIRRALKEARWVVITHYHHDHQVPYLPDVFPDPPPEVWLKSPEDTNRSQRARAALLIERLRDRGVAYRFADGAVWQVGTMTLRFSPSLLHGATPRLGRVVMVGVEVESSRILYTSDIQGPVREEHRDAILRMAPHVLFLDPPPAPGGRMPEVFFRYVEEVVGALPGLSHLVVDHHPLRDARWMRWWSILESVVRDRGVRLQTGAQWNGWEPRMLEAGRCAYWRARERNGEAGDGA